MGKEGSKPPFFFCNLAQSMKGIPQAIEEKIREIVASTLPESFIVDIKFKPVRGANLVIRIDTDKGINLDECKSVSRAVGKWLDETDPFDFEYNLEVTSPGIGEPLVLPRQYIKDIGRRLRVIAGDGSVHEGTLTQADDSKFTIEKDPPKKKKKAGEPEEELAFHFEYDKIKEAKVLIVF